MFVIKFTQEYMLNDIFTRHFNKFGRTMKYYSATFLTSNIFLVPFFLIIITFFHVFEVRYFP